MGATLKSVVGIGVCTGVATVLTVLLGEAGEVRFAAPAICLLVVIVTSVYFGRLSGFLGAHAAALTMALWLFPPIGSLWVQEHAAQAMLIVLQAGATGVVLLIPSRPGAASRPRIGWQRHAASESGADHPR